MTETFELIANTIVDSLEYNYPEIKNKLNFDTQNSYKYSKLDIINTELSKKLTDEKYIFHGFKRYGWEGRMLVDLQEENLISITSESNLNDLIRSKDNRKYHYIPILSSFNSTTNAANVQLCFEGFENYEMYESKRVKILEGLKIDVSSYKYHVITFELENGKISALNSYVLTPKFDIIEKISLMKLVRLDYRDLSRFDSNELEYNDNNTELINNRENKQNKGIKLGLKKEYLKKQS